MPAVTSHLLLVARRLIGLLRSTPSDQVPSCNRYGPVRRISPVP